MRFAEFLSAATFAAGVSTVLAEDAPVIKNNPPGGVAFSVFKTDGLDAVVAASTGPNGEGVHIVMNINGERNTPMMGGPFMYHIHDKQIASSGDCASAGAHLDPTGRGESPGCDATKPETCQVGDLSGKWGNCQNVPGCSKTFTDKYLSLTPGTPAYIGDKSFVLHYANKTRIACANFSYGPQTGPKDSSAAPAASGASSSAASLSSAASSVSASASMASSSVAAGATGTSPLVTVPPPAAPVVPTPEGAANYVKAVGGLTGAVIAFLGLALW